MTDVKALVGLLWTLQGEEPPAEPADGVYELETDGPTVYIQEKGGWAFIVNDRDALANVPADPIKLLDGLNDKYDLAIRASIKNIPAAFREMFTAQLQLGAEAGMQRMPGESDEDYALRTGVAKQMIQQMITMIDELDDVLLGFAVDQTAGTSYLDFEITAVTGTKLAAQFAQMTPGKTNFGGFDLPGAAATGNWAGTLTDADVTQTKAALVNIRATALNELKNEGLSADELKLATQLIGDLLDVAEKTVENKISDGGLVLMLKPDALTFVFGGTIAETAKAEKVLKQLAQLVATEDPEIAKGLKLDAETYQGIRCHTLAIPVPEPDAQKVFGQSLDVVVGIGAESIYAAAGRDAVATLKQVIDASAAAAGKEIPPMRISVAATPIVQFVAAMAEEEEVKQMAAMLAAGLEESADKDHLTITSEPVTNGARVRVEVEEGILKLIGMAGQMATGAMVPPMMPGGPGIPGGEPAPGDSPF